MDTALAALVFAPGLAIGSFLNVVAARVPRRESIISPPSACPGCGMRIAWYDNIPILSYLLLRGRCRGCKTHISWTYPAVELSTALLVSLSFLRFGLTPKAVVVALFCATLVVISVTDLELRIIPNWVVLPAAACVLAAQTVISPSVVWVAASLGTALVLLLAGLAYPGGMGMGDVKLGLLLGAALGTTVPVALMIGFVAALLPAVVLLVKHGGAARKMGIPLGPFLALGGGIAVFAGSGILHAYLQLG